MKGRSIREFASSATMSAGTLHNYLNGESLPTLDKLLSLVNTSGVDLGWLATGVGSMQFGSDITINNPTKPCSINVKYLTMILESVENAEHTLGIGMKVEKKCDVTSAIYDIVGGSDEQSVNREKIQRLVQSTLSP